MRRTDHYCARRGGEKKLDNSFNVMYTLIGDKNETTDRKKSYSVKHNTSNGFMGMATKSR